MVTHSLFFKPFKISGALFGRDVFFIVIVEFEVPRFVTSITG